MGMEDYHVVGDPDLAPDLPNDPVYDKIYPVGSVYITFGTTSPASLFGGTWSRITNRFLVAAGSSYTAGNMGGSATVTPSGTVDGHTLTVSEMPSHSHKVGRLLKASSGSDMTVATTYTTSGQHSQVESYYTGGGGSHSHGLTMDSHTNLPPWYAVYMWRRVS